MLTPIQLLDLDIGSNGEITYSITSVNTGWSFVKIDGSSGLITTRRPIDRETLQSFTLSVCATDKGSTPRSSCVQVNVAVGDINDFGPEFTGTKNFAVTENAGRGTYVGTVKTTDQDIGEAFIC